MGCPYQTPPLKAQGPMQKRWEDSKSPSSGSKEEPSRYNRADAHVNSQRINSMHKTRTNASQTKSPVWRRGSGYIVSPLNKKLFAADSWERENQFSPVECSWVYQPHSRAGLMLRSEWPIQMDSMFVFFMILLLLFVVLLSFFALFSCFYFMYYERTNMNWVGWVGKN